MKSLLFSDPAIEALIAGEPVDGMPAELTSFITALAAQGDRISMVRAEPELAEFFTRSPAPVLAPKGTGSARRLRTKGAVLVGAAGAKVLLGASLAAASAAGAHATGIVDVPGIRSIPYFDSGNAPDVVLTPNTSLPVVADPSATIVPGIAGGGEEPRSQQLPAEPAPPISSPDPGKSDANSVDGSSGDKSKDKSEADKSKDKSQGDKPEDKSQGDKSADKSQGDKSDDKSQGDKSDDKSQGDKSQDKSQGDKSADASASSD